MLIASSFGIVSIQFASGQANQDNSDKNNANSLHVQKPLAVFIFCTNSTLRRVPYQWIMNFRLADPELKAMQEAEITELLNQPIYLRVAMINARDGTPLVHPIWYNYKDENFRAVSNRDGIKVRSLKKNPEVYFLVDITDRGVRGRVGPKSLTTLSTLQR